MYLEFNLRTCWTKKLEMRLAILVRKFVTLTCLSDPFFFWKQLLLEAGFLLPQSLLSCF